MGQLWSFGHTMLGGAISQSKPKMGWLQAMGLYHMTSKCCPVSLGTDPFHFIICEACKGGGFNCPHFVGCRHSKAKDRPRPICVRDVGCLVIILEV
jgi:hypothetical protein